MFTVKNEADGRSGPTRLLVALLVLGLAVSTVPIGALAGPGDASPDASFDLELVLREHALSIENGDRTAVGRLKADVVPAAWVEVWVDGSGVASSGPVVWSVSAAPGVEITFDSALVREEGVDLDASRAFWFEAPNAGRVAMSLRPTTPGHHSVEVEAAVLLESGETLTASRTIELVAVADDGEPTPDPSDTVDPPVADDGSTRTERAVETDGDDRPDNRRSEASEEPGTDDGSSDQEEPNAPSTDSANASGAVEDSRSEEANNPEIDESNEEPGSSGPTEPGPADDGKPPAESVEPDGDETANPQVVGSYLVVPALATPTQAFLQASDGHPDIASGSVTLDDVHVDVGARIIDGELAVLIKDGTSATTPVWRRPADVTLVAKEASEITIPANPAFSFLGSPGGQSWVLPQVQRAGLLWPGWNTEAIVPGTLSGPVTWRLTGVNGPGRFSIFLTNSFGVPSVIFDSSNGLPDSYTIPVGTHAHGNWAFSAPGTYRLTFEMSATLAAGGSVSDQGVVTFVVQGELEQQPEDAEPETPGDDDNPGTDDNQESSNQDSGSTLPQTGPRQLETRVAAASALLLLGVALVLATRPRNPSLISS
ncbi:MAG: TIGR03773 family transporter-associated surface protein [Acidimicrobiia bacterium]